MLAVAADRMDEASPSRFARDTWPRAVDASRSRERLQRTQGKLRVSFQRAPDGATQLVDLFQEGCLKARLPRSQCAGDAEVVILNTAGGLTGGDRLSMIDVSAGEKIPRKGGPGITRSDLLVINKIDLAQWVGGLHRRLSA